MNVTAIARSPEFKYMRKEWSEEMVDSIIVHLDMTTMGLREIGGFWKFKNLRELNISCNFIAKLGKIEWPPLLEVLYMNGNKIEEIVNVPRKLVILGIAYNQITKICEMPSSLKILDIRGNLISEVRELMKCPVDLLSLKCEENPIELIANIGIVLQNRYINGKINNKKYEIISESIDRAQDITTFVVKIQVAIECKLAEYVKMNKITTGSITISIPEIDSKCLIDVKNMVALQKKKENSILLEIVVPLSKLSIAFAIFKKARPTIVRLSFGTKATSTEASFSDELLLSVDNNFELKLKLQN